MRRKGLRFPNGIPRAVTTDDLRHRIAYAIAQADGDAPGMKPASCDYEMADSVIEALLPKREGRWGWIDGTVSTNVKTGNPIKLEIAHLQRR